METGQGYQYRISATDSAGNEGPTTAAVDVYLAGTSPPRAVRNIQAVAGSDGTRLRWEPVPDASITGYIIMRSKLSNGRYTEVSEHAADATEWTDTGGRAGNWYRVVAVNADGGRSTGGSPARFGLEKTSAILVTIAKNHPGYTFFQMLAGRSLEQAGYSGRAVTVYLNAGSSEARLPQFHEISELSRQPGI